MGCFQDVGLKIQSLELVKYAVISYFNFFYDRNLLKKCASTKCCKVKVEERIWKFC